MKKLGTRARAMVLSCLVRSDDEDKDENLPDFYDYSRSSSPVQITPECLGLQENLNKANFAINNNLHEDNLNETLSLITNNLAGETTDKAVSTSEFLVYKNYETAYEPPAHSSQQETPVNDFSVISKGLCTSSEKFIKLHPHSPLTLVPSNATSPVVNRCGLLTAPISKKNILPPPYSPLGPPLYAVPPSANDHDVVMETAAEKSIEPPPYSPLTPAPLNAVPPPVGDYDLVTETTAEKSIELPPYSPLTPAPHAVPPSNNDHDIVMETASEKSIEPPPYSPLTPAPLNNVPINHNIPLTNTVAENGIGSPYSPLPVMSPDMEKMCRILENCLDDDSPKVTNNLTADDEGLAPYSDDSIKDPDYDNNNDSTSSSNDSFTSGTTSHAHIRPTPAEGNQIEEGHIVPVSRNDTTSVNGDSLIVESSTETVADKETELTQTDTLLNGRPKKGRKRTFGGLSREERKKRKYMNLPYVNSRKKCVGTKNFIDYQCSCSKKCYENISSEKRKVAFKKFYSLGSYDAQNMFLNALVKECPVKRHYVATENKNKVSKKKAFSRQYFLDGISVCKDMFIKTFQTSSKRINTSLYKMRSENCIVDKRGLQSGRNKVPPECELFVINLIKKLPTYISHYRREQCKGVKYLRSDMTVSKIFELYKEEAKAAAIRILSLSKVNQIFLNNFNLRTKPLKKDTCNKCDYFYSQMLTASEEEKSDIDLKQKAHIDLANGLQTQLKMDMKLANDDPSVETITFDLEKTLPLPRIPTNIVFYKRQLWVYNLGIHTGSRDEAHCNVWVEGEAGRGAQEVGSCLMKHIFERLDSSVKRLILWSDSCGGQNRNIKMVLMMKAILNDHPTLKQINLKFLESGHSFLPNDTDFGKIETALKRHQRLYTPEDYMDIMKSCKRNNPLKVHRMNQHDFFSSLKLEKNITNRKKYSDGTKVSWLATKEIELRKHEIFKIYMRSNFDEEFKEVDIKKSVRGRVTNITKDIMEPLWPLGKPIADAKLKDLKSLLHLIPQVNHNFYVKLIPDENIEDDLEGFSGEPDFEMEGETNE